MPHHFTGCGWCRHQRTLELLYYSTYLCSSCGEISHGNCFPSRWSPCRFFRGEIDNHPRGTVSPILLLNHLVQVTFSCGCSRPKVFGFSRSAVDMHTVRVKRSTGLVAKANEYCAFDVPVTLDKRLILLLLKGGLFLCWKSIFQILRDEIGVMAEKTSPSSCDKCGRTQFVLTLRKIPKSCW